MRWPSFGARASACAVVAAALSKAGERLGEPAALYADLADQVQRARAAAERARIQPLGRLPVVVGEHLLAHGIERIQPAGGLELAAQVAEHELEQVLGLRMLQPGLGARVDRGDGEQRSHGHAGDRGRRDHRHAARVALRVAVHEFIHAGTRAQHAGDELEDRQTLAVALRTQVRGHRFERLAAGTAIRRQRETQRRGQAFLGLAPGIRVANGSPSTISASTRLSPCMRLNSTISRLTHSLRAALGEHSTIR